MADALFEVDGELFLPTDHTRGGWSDDAQHGSPPAGLFARELEKVPTQAPMRVVRFTVDLFREVPLTPLRVETRVIRDGRRIQLVEAAMSDEKKEVGRAVALKIRVGDLGHAGEQLEGNAGEDHPPSTSPQDLARLEWSDHFGVDADKVRFHTDAVEIRTVDDSFVREVPGESWFRVLLPLIRGEETTPFQRAALMSDLANGNSQALDPKQWLFVNPDITLYLHRQPQSEWLAMRSVARQVPEGIGVTETSLYDREGRIGSVLQSQVIQKR